MIMEKTNWTNIIIGSSNTNWMYPMKYFSIRTTARKIFISLIFSILIIFTSIIHIQLTVAQDVEPFTTKNISNPPTITMYEQLNIGKNKTESLGNHAFCLLSQVGTVHSNQACTCRINYDDSAKNWQLELRLDENVNGRCRCQAMCID